MLSDFLLYRNSADYQKGDGEKKGSKRRTTTTSEWEEQLEVGHLFINYNVCFPDSGRGKLCEV